MNSKAAVVVVALLCCAAATSSGEDEFMSYTLDGKAVRLSEVKLLRHSDNYLTIEGELREEVDFGEYSRPRYREAVAGLTFQLMPLGASFVGTHRGNSSDSLPVYLSWYEIGEEGGVVTIFSWAADMEGSHPEQLFTVHVAEYGEAGALVTGTFSGKLLGEDGKLHEVADGAFAIRRTDVQD